MKNKSIILYLLSLGIFLEIVDSSIVNISMLYFAKQFNAGIQKVSLISSVYTIGLGIFTPLSIYYSKKYSLSNAAIIGFSFFGFGSVLCACSGTSLIFLLISRVIQSFGASFMVPISRIFIRKYYKENLLQIAAKTSFIFLLGYALGPVIGSIIIRYLPWQFIFIINIPLILFAIILLKINLIKEESTYEHTFDFIGYLYYAFIILIFMNLKQNLLFVFGLVLLVYLFYRHISENKYTILSKNLFRNHLYVFQVLSAFLTRTSTVQFMLIFPLFLQIKANITNTFTAMIMMFYCPGAMLARYCIKNSLLKLSSLYSIIALAILFIVFLLFNNLSDNLYFYLIIYFLFGFFSSLTFAHLNSNSLLSLDKLHIEEGAVLYSSILQIGASFGFLIFQILPKNSFNLCLILNITMLWLVVILKKFYKII